MHTSNARDVALVAGCAALAGNTAQAAPEAIVRESGFAMSARRIFHAEHQPFWLNRTTRFRAAMPTDLAFHSDDSLGL